jgi:thiol-disulfide isomerase/thioredoxin
MIRLLSVFLLVSFSWATAASAKPSHVMDLPKAISDSLPWFAVREFSENALPFTRSHLTKIAQKNERTALVYFATWCIPCRAGVKRLVENYDELQKNRLAIVLVNIGERDEKLVKSWIEKTNASKFVVVNDPFKRLTEGFGLVAESEEISLPRTIVLDKNAKPLFMLGEEGGDWPHVLWSK